MQGQFQSKVPVPDFCGVLGGAWEGAGQSGWAQAWRCDREVESKGKALPIPLCTLVLWFFKEFQNESGKIRRGIYMVFEGFPLFYKYFIFSIKKNH